MHFNRRGKVSTRTIEKISKAIFFFFSRNFNMRAERKRQLLGEDVNPKVSCAF